MDDKLKKMQELLVDYVLNRISIKDKEFFEENIDKYPEIHNELLQAQKLFKRIDETDFDGIISHKTRNMSIKVKEKYNKSYSKSESRLRFISRLVLPSMGVVVILFIMFTDFEFSNIFKSPENQSEITLIPDTLLNDVEINNYQVDEFNTLSNSINIENQIVIEDQLFDELNTEFIADYLDKDQNDNLIEIDYLSEYSLYENLNTLDEDEFQEIIEEIKNENIIN